MKKCNHEMLFFDNPIADAYFCQQCDDFIMIEKERKMEKEERDAVVEIISDEIQKIFDKLDKMLDSQIQKILDNFDKMDNKLNKILDYLEDIDGEIAHNKCSHIPNSETKKAIENIKKGIGLHKCANIDELFKELYEDE